VANLKPALHALVDLLPDDELTPAALHNFRSAIGCMVALHTGEPGRNTVKERKAGVAPPGPGKHIGPHMWMVEPPNGPTSKGTCRKCGLVRDDFANSLPEPTFNNGRKAAKV